MNDPGSVPKELIRALREGQCVAFVGAGFSASAVPTWVRLLQRASEGLQGDAAATARELLESRNPSARELEAAAQLLVQAATKQGFAERVRRIVGENENNANLERRKELLRGIPFRAVLTTNFDGLLPGVLPGHAAYGQVLRPRAHRWWDARFWEGRRPGATVVELHGSVRQPETVVLSTRDYRERLYSDPAYVSFLRSVFATTTLLFLGFSFTDAYLNGIISEVLSLIGHEPSAHPIAYAIASDVSPALAEYYRQHEGIQMITFRSEFEGGRDFSGFDRLLQEIHDESNPKLLLGRILAGKKIVWLDAQPDNNEFGMQFLREAAQACGAGTPCEITQATSCDEALRELDSHGGAESDLVITHWGHGREWDDGPTSVAVRLLKEMGRRQLYAPVIVFASGQHAVENRRTALRMGAQAYVSGWSDLFREIARVVGDEA